MAAKRRAIVKEDLNIGYGPTTIPTDSGGTRVASKFGFHTLTGIPNVSQIVHAGGDSGALQQAIDDQPGGGSVYLPAGTHHLTTGIVIACQRLNLYGAGRQATILNFAPTQAATCLKFINGSSVMNQCSVKNMAFTGSNGYKKIGINLVDTSDMVLEDLAFYPWTGAVSEAIKLEGREMTHIHRVQASADLPLHIAVNPNASLSVDHLYCTNCYFIGVDATQPIVLIDSGVNLSRVHFIDQAWVQGKHGLYWVDTATSIQSNNLVLRNVYWENALDTNGYFVRIEHNRRLRNLQMDGVEFGNNGNGCNGIYLRKCQEISLRNAEYAEEQTALDLDSTCSGLYMDNVLIASVTPTISLTGVRGISGSYFHEGTGKMYSFAPNTPNIAGLVVQQINPSTTLGFSQLDPLTITVEANTVIKLGSTELIGILMITALTLTVHAIFAIDGTNALTKVMAFSDAGYWGVAAASVNFNVYASGGEYKLQNNTASPETFKLNFFGKGEY